MSIFEEERLNVAVVDDEDFAREFIGETIGRDGSISYEEFSDADEFIHSDISKFHIFVIDKIFGRETRVQELIRKIRSESSAEIIVFSNDPSSEIFDEGVIRVLKGAAFLGPSVLRTAVLNIIHKKDDRFKYQARAIQKLDASDSQGQSTINEIRLEGIAYPLRKATDVYWDGHEYSIEGLDQHIRGSGETSSSAMKAFVRKFHDVFLRLNRHLNKGEMLNGDDRLMWSAIKRIVDIEQYERMRTIIVPFEIGRVEFTDTIGLYKIYWATRDKSDIVEVEKVPSLAVLNDGDWITAIVRRRTDESLDAVLYTQWIEPPTYTQDEIEKFWNQ
jgi:hypothetical protein